MSSDLNRCPKCKKMTWRMIVYVHIDAPAELNHQFSKKNLRRKDVQIAGALWETSSWYCANHKCMFHLDGPKRVRLEDIPNSL